MSANKVTVKEVIEALQKLPQDMSVVCFGGIYGDSNFDGARVYKHVFHEKADGFTPVAEEDIDKDDWDCINDPHCSDVLQECIVVSSIPKESIVKWGRANVEGYWDEKERETRN